ncbi:type II CAAX endopeptidase family protein [Niveispirillum sp. SYP-B3756]|uniref:CPBP family intramembrane glutamic endopeptidase n=1 Tax=Niveispirillum sp. SYP-B3756 TaxID=2662178 RepID=UPI0015666EA2|nr:type II CAAX endopeptidase family protein [Niveispirillum sp. SYP-B3756]
MGVRLTDYLGGLVVFICLSALTLVLAVCIGTIIVALAGPSVRPSVTGLMGLALMGSLLWALHGSLRLQGRNLMSVIAPGQRLHGAMFLRSALVYMLCMTVVSAPQALMGNLHIGLPSLSQWLWLPALVVGFAGQTAAEEAVCRGYLAQAFQILCRNAALAAVPVALIFAALHLNFPLEKRMGLIGFSLFASYLTWQFGRLEATIGVHIAHNMFISVLAKKAPGFPSLRETAAKATLPSLDLSGVLAFLVTLLLTALLYWLLGVRTGFIEQGWRPRSRTDRQMSQHRRKSIIDRISIQRRNHE